MSPSAQHATLVLSKRDIFNDSDHCAKSALQSLRHRPAPSSMQNNSQPSCFQGSLCSHSTHSVPHQTDTGCSGGPPFSHQHINSVLGQKVLQYHAHRVANCYSLTCTSTRKVLQSGMCTNSGVPGLVTNLAPGACVQHNHATNQHTASVRSLQLEDSHVEHGTSTNQQPINFGSSTSTSWHNLRAQPCINQPVSRTAYSNNLLNTVALW
jgi:hypothetical protein